MIRLEVPRHLRELAGIEGDVVVEVAGTPTLGAVLDALEMLHPEIRGTLRDPVTGRRRALLRFYALGQDLSNEGMAVRLPEAVARGEEPLIVIGAIAGG